MAPVQTSVCPKPTKLPFSTALYFSNFTGRGREWGNLHHFGLTTSILHPIGLIPEQMAAATCGSLLVLREGDVVWGGLSVEETVLMFTTCIL